MVALRTPDQQTQAPQPSQYRATLIDRMSGQYWRIARRERVLLNIGQIIRDDLVILPLQCQEARVHLLALRRACQEAHSFYSTLASAPMKQVAPWGTLVKLQVLEEQTTELILLLDALKPISTAPIYNRVQLQLAVRRLYPHMLFTFDELTGQLAALVTKVQEQQASQAEEARV